ncbi:hypothetical protein EON67_03110, partial [archaeon]
MLTRSSVPAPLQCSPSRLRVGHIAACMQAAAAHYEHAGVHLKEVPRMLHDAHDFGALDEYVASHPEPALLQWYGQYLESQGNNSRAAAIYRQAGDVLSVVRMACAAGDFAAGMDMVAETSNAAAAFHLARQLEMAGRQMEAIACYEKSGRLSHAVRLAKESGAEGELMSMALQSNKRIQLDIARHFEMRGQFERAVQL